MTLFMVVLLGIRICSSRLGVIPVNPVDARSYAAFARG